jgi:hypothetical protein
MGEEFGITPNDLENICRSCILTCSLTLMQPCLFDASVSPTHMANRQLEILVMSESRDKLQGTTIDTALLGKDSGDKHNEPMFACLGSSKTKRCQLEDTPVCGGLRMERVCTVSEEGLAKTWMGAIDFSTHAAP